MFCDYLCDARYEWVQGVSQTASIRCPTQVCHEWNTVAHLNEYEGNPAGVPSATTSCRRLFDYLDDRVERVARSGRKGALGGAARRPDDQDARTPSGCAATSCAASRWPTCGPTRTSPSGAPTDRSTCATARPSKGGVPRRRTVLAVPEFDWAIGGLRQWVEEARPLLDPGDHPALWLTERLHSDLAQAPRQAVLRGCATRPVWTRH